MPARASERGFRRLVDGNATVDCPLVEGRVPVKTCYSCMAWQQFGMIPSGLLRWVRCAPVRRAADVVDASATADVAPAEDEWAGV